VLRSAAVCVKGFGIKNLFYIKMYIKAYIKTSGKIRALTFG
jgi:hypothetical protein